MIELTLVLGPKALLDGTKVLRIRGAVKLDDPAAKTRIDWDEPMVVTEEPEFVAGKVGAELPDLRQLSYITGKPVWFNGKKASGPLRLLSSEAVDGVRSAFMIGGKKQLVANTHEEVAAIIASAKGDVRPIPTDNFFQLPMDMFATVRGWFAPVPVWD